MKRYLILLSMLMITVSWCSVCCAEEIAYNAETGFHFDWWENNNGDRGSQYYVPLKLGADYEDFNIQMLTAFAYTNSNPSHADTVTLSCIVDTKMNLSYTVTDRLPFDVLVGLDFNLPTGKNDLDEHRIGAIMDPDLVTITYFGEGFNINPTITVAKDWDDWSMGIGLGYLVRGEYDYSYDVKDYDPGNIFNLTASLEYYFNDQWSANLLTRFASFGMDEVKGDDYFKQGAMVEVGVGLNHFATAWDASAGMKYLIRTKCEFPEPDSGVVQEEHNSYGNEFQADLAGHYYLDKKTTLNGLFNFLYVEENDYPSSSNLFIGSRAKTTFGAGVSRALTDHINAALNLSGFYMTTERNWYQDGDRTYNGFSADIRFTGSF